MKQTTKINLYMYIILDRDLLTARHTSFSKGWNFVSRSNRTIKNLKYEFWTLEISWRNSIKEVLLPEDCGVPNFIAANRYHRHVLFFKNKENRVQIFHLLSRPVIAKVRPAKVFNPARRESIDMDSIWPAIITFWRLGSIKFKFYLMHNLQVKLN